MENEDSLKIERLEDDGLQDVSGGKPAIMSPITNAPKRGSSYQATIRIARDCTMCQYWKQVVIPGIRAECRY